MAKEKKMTALLDKLYEDTQNYAACDAMYPAPIPIQSPGLNWVLNGGIHPGSFIDLAGPESSGKSMIAMHMVVEMLKAKPDSVVLYFATEPFSNHYLNVLLPNPEDQRRLVVRPCTTGPEIFDYFAKTIVGMREDGLNVVACVVDSLQMISAPRELALESTDKHVMGDLSSYLPKALRLIAPLSKPRLREGFDGTTWIFVSQIRLNLDPSAIYTGQKYVISGGKAFRHALDVEILFEPIEAKKAKIFSETDKGMSENFQQVGHRVRAKVTKNKLGPPHRVAEFDIMYDKGIVNQANEVAILGMMLGVLNKQGNTFYLGDKKIAVGGDATIAAIGADPELQKQILAGVMKTSTDETVV